MFTKPVKEIVFFCCIFCCFKRRKTMHHKADHCSSEEKKQQQLWHNLTALRSPPPPPNPHPRFKEITRIIIQYHWQICWQRYLKYSYPRCDTLYFPARQSILWPCQATGNPTCPEPSSPVVPVKFGLSSSWISTWKSAGTVRRIHLSKL